MNVLIDDVPGYLKCKYYKKPEQDLKLMTDITLAFKISKSKTINQIIFPYMDLSELKVQDISVKKYVALISDLYIGRKFFSESKSINFINKSIKWLN